jgi:hypothetical protein
VLDLAVVTLDGRLRLVESASGEVTATVELEQVVGAAWSNAGDRLAVVQQAGGPSPVTTVTILDAALGVEAEYAVSLPERTVGYPAVQSSWSADDRFLSVASIYDNRAALIDLEVGQVAELEAATAGFMSEDQLLLSFSPDEDSRLAVLTIATLDDLSERILPERGWVGDTSARDGVAMVYTPFLFSVDGWLGLRTLDDGPEQIIALGETGDMLLLTDDARATLRDAGVLVSRDADGRCP